MSKDQKKLADPFLSVVVPPNITSVRARKDIRAFRKYMGMMSALDHELVGQFESARLATIFAAMDARLREQQEKDLDFGPQKPVADGITTKAFQMSVQATRSTVLSVPTIMPIKTMYNFFDERTKRGKKYGAFEYLSYYGFQPYMMGMMQARRTDSKHRIDSTVSVSVIALDDSMMKSIARYDSRKLLASLQAISAFANHDLYHQITGTLANQGLSYNTRLPSYRQRFLEIDKSYFHEKDNEDRIRGYEGWARKSYAHTWEKLKDTPHGLALLEHVETYFNELDRIANDFIDERYWQLAGKFGHEDNREYFASWISIHEDIDYFSTLACYTLSWLMPMDAELMEYALLRAEQADPGPESLDITHLLMMEDERLEQVFRELSAADLKAIHAKMTDCEIGKTISPAYNNQLWQEHGIDILMANHKGDTGMASRRTVRDRLHKAKAKALVSDIREYWYLVFDEVPLKKGQEFAKFLLDYPVRDGKQTIPLREKLLFPASREVLNNYRKAGRLQSGASGLTDYGLHKIQELIEMDPDFASLHAPEQPEDAPYHARTTRIDKDFISGIIESDPEGGSPYPRRNPRKKRSAPKPEPDSPISLA